MLIPCGDALHNLRLHGLFHCKVRHAKALTLEDADPLCHLLHPGPVRGREVAAAAGLPCPPLLDLLAMLATAGVAPHVEQGNPGGALPVAIGQQGEARLLAFAPGAWPLDLARARVEGCKELQGPLTLVLVCDALGPVVWLGRRGGLPPWPWWQRGRFIHGEPQRMPG